MFFSVSLICLHCTFGDISGYSCPSGLVGETLNKDFCAILWLPGSRLYESLAPFSKMSPVFSCCCYMEISVCCLFT
uniref:Secreted protein n=1 Tax=Xenopus tropicalis TaxID=8364 RepID=A0A1B8XV33_XENTR